MSQSLKVIEMKRTSTKCVDCDNYRPTKDIFTLWGLRKSQANQFAQCSKFVDIAEQIIGNNEEGEEDIAFALAARSYFDKGGVCVEFKPNS